MEDVGRFGTRTVTGAVAVDVGDDVVSSKGRSRHGSGRDRLDSTSQCSPGCDPDHGSSRG